ncbi:hypothetical protein V5799_025395 [Amblyomma americanum]|uniref:Uncharacterized protein n=1 Tax=Amblyomma americanum TaxID=6943 RepID=A0AAQ4E9C7_AMBAM
MVIYEELLHEEQTLTMRKGYIRLTPPSNADARSNVRRVARPTLGQRRPPGQVRTCISTHQQPTGQVPTCVSTQATIRNSKKRSAEKENQPESPKRAPKCFRV